MKSKDMQYPILLITFENIKDKDNLWGTYSDVIIMITSICALFLTIVSVIISTHLFSVYLWYKSMLDNIVSNQPEDEDGNIKHTGIEHELWENKQDTLRKQMNNSYKEYMDSLKE